MAADIRVFCTLGQAFAEGLQVSSAHPTLVWKQCASGWIMAVVLPMKRSA
jgi:hypothetical protein